MNQVYLKLGELLLAHKAITETQLEAALELQANSGRRLGEILVEQGFVDDKTIAQCLAQQYGCEIVEPGTLEPEQDALAVMDPIEALGKRVLPVRFDDHGLYCVISDPLNLPVTDDLVNRVKRPIHFSVAPESELLIAIRSHFGLTSPEDTAEFAVCLPKRYKEPEYRGRTGEIIWGDAVDTVLNRRVSLFRAPERGVDGDEHWDLIRDAAIRHDSIFVPVFDSQVHKGFRWTSFELIRGESLGSIIRKRGPQTPSQAAEIITEVARATYESASALHRRSWISPENIWVDGSRATIAPALPVPEAYAESSDEIEALGSLLLHCLTGRYNLHRLDNCGLSASVPIGMVRILQRCFHQPGSEPFETSKDLALAIQSFRWTPSSTAEPARSLDREELLATISVVTPKRASLWDWFVGRRAA
jgi:hypothetical protein